MRARLLVLGVLVQALMLLLAIGGSYALSLHIIATRDQAWCPILHHALARPGTDAAARADLARLGRQFGC